MASIIGVENLQHPNGTTAATVTSSGKLGVATLAHTNGTTAATIDTAGRILTPTRPAFSARGSSSSWVSASDGQEITIALNTADTNVGGHFNTSTYRFTAPIAGLYQVQAMVYLRNNNSTQSDSGSYGYARIKKNGSAGSDATTLSSIHGYLNSGDADQTHSIHGVVNMAVNDYLTLHLSSEGGGTSEYYAVHCGMSGYLIG